MTEVRFRAPVRPLTAANEPNRMALKQHEFGIHALPGAVAGRYRAGGSSICRLMASAMAW